MYVFIYLIVLSLSCRMWDLLVAANEILNCSMQDLVPGAGTEPMTSVLRAQSLSQWITREIPLPDILTHFQGR